MSWQAASCAEWIDRRSRGLVGEAENEVGTHRGQHAQDRVARRRERPGGAAQERCRQERAVHSDHRYERRRNDAGARQSGGDIRLSWSWRVAGRGLRARELSASGGEGFRCGHGCGGVKASGRTERRDVQREQRLLQHLPLPDDVFPHALRPAQHKWAQHHRASLVRGEALAAPPNVTVQGCGWTGASAQRLCALRLGRLQRQRV